LYLVTIVKAFEACKSVILLAPARYVFSTAIQKYPAMISVHWWESCGKTHT